jgi:hypothetical protein
VSNSSSGICLVWLTSVSVGADGRSVRR